MGEKTCRAILKELCGKPFPSVRPKWMPGKKGRPLELDCYCEELKIALEYQGSQHYCYTEHFHSSQEAFEDQKERDKLKAKLCKEKGIRLLIVPYTVEIPELYSHIRNLLSQPVVAEGEA